MFPIIISLSLRRATRLVLGASLGIAAGIVVYFISQRERQEAEVFSEEKALSPRPDHKIALQPPVETREIQPAILPLTLSAEPVRFIRREPGTIYAKTLPGATCNVEAIYSTNRRPGSLETGPTAVDADGRCQWTWVIGTSGTHVDVTVRASLAGYEQAEAALRVEIGT